MPIPDKQSVMEAIDHQLDKEHKNSGSGFAIFVDSKHYETLRTVVKAYLSGELVEAMSETDITTIIDIVVSRFFDARMPILVNKIANALTHKIRPQEKEIDNSYVTLPQKEYFKAVEDLQRYKTALERIVNYYDGVYEGETHPIKEIAKQALSEKPQKDCPKCKGLGMVEDFDGYEHELIKCLECNGTGLLKGKLCP